jgi:hypothetical protein
MDGNSTAKDKFDGSIIRRPTFAEVIACRGMWEFEARDPNGNLLWRDGFDNLVVDEGLNEMLGLMLDRSTSPAYTKQTAWYIGLVVETGSPAYAASDTLSTNPNWNEVTAYSEANRQTFTDGGVSAKSLDNSASKATFTINADSTVLDGGLLASNNTKGGTTGILYSVGAFTGGQKTLDTNDTIDVQATFTIAAA